MVMMEDVLLSRRARTEALDAAAATEELLEADCAMPDQDALIEKLTRLDAFSLEKREAMVKHLRKAVDDTPSTGLDGANGRITDGMPFILVAVAVLGNPLDSEACRLALLKLDVCPLCWIAPFPHERTNICTHAHTHTQTYAHTNIRTHKHTHAQTTHRHACARTKARARTLPLPPHTSSPLIWQ